MAAKLKFPLHVIFGVLHTQNMHEDTKIIIVARLVQEPHRFEENIPKMAAILKAILQFKMAARLELTLHVIFRSLKTYM